MIFGQEISLGKIFGIKIALDYSWFWIFFIIVITFSSSILPKMIPNKSALVYLLYGIFSSLLFFASVVIHELGHSLAARMNNLPIRKITLFVFGGASNLIDEPPSAKAEFRMAIVGPLFSLIVGSLFVAVATLLKLYWPSLSVSPLLLTLGFINFGLALFNLLPGFPLDGGRVLRSVIWWQTRDLLKATKYSSIVGKILSVIFILYGIWQTIAISIVGGFWTILIAIFLFRMANSSYSQTKAILTLRTLTAQDLVNKSLVAIDFNVPIAQLIKDGLHARSQYCFVVSNSQKVGIFHTSWLQQIPRSKWQTPVQRIAAQLSEIPSLKADSSAINALDCLSDSEPHIVLVRDKDSDILGIISFDELRRVFDPSNSKV